MDNLDDTAWLDAMFPEGEGEDVDNMFSGPPGSQLTPGSASGAGLPRFPRPAPPVLDRTASAASALTVESDVPQDPLVQQFRSIKKRKRLNLASISETIGVQKSALSKWNSGKDPSWAHRNLVVKWIQTQNASDATADNRSVRNTPTPSQKPLASYASAPMEHIPRQSPVQIKNSNANMPPVHMPPSYSGHNPLNPMARPPQYPPAAHQSSMQQMRESYNQPRSYSSGGFGMDEPQRPPLRVPSAAGHLEGASGMTPIGRNSPFAEMNQLNTNRVANTAQEDRSDWPQETIKSLGDMLKAETNSLLHKGIDSAIKDYLVVSRNLKEKMALGEGTMSDRKQIDYFYRKQSKLLLNRLTTICGDDVVKKATSMLHQRKNSNSLYRPQQPGQNVGNPHQNVAPRNPNPGSVVPYPGAPSVQRPPAAPGQVYHSMTAPRPDQPQMAQSVGQQIVTGAPQATKNTVEAQQMAQLTRIWNHCCTCRDDACRAQACAKIKPSVLHQKQLKEEKRTCVEENCENCALYKKLKSFSDLSKSSAAMVPRRVDSTTQPPQAPFPRTNYNPHQPPSGNYIPNGHASTDLVPANVEIKRSESRASLFKGERVQSPMNRPPSRPQSTGFIPRQSPLPGGPAYGANPNRPGFPNQQSQYTQSQYSNSTSRDQYRYQESHASQDRTRAEDPNFARYTQANQNTSNVYHEQNQVNNHSNYKTTNVNYNTYNIHTAPSIGRDDKTPSTSEKKKSRNDDDDMSAVADILDERKHNLSINVNVNFGPRSNGAGFGNLDVRNENMYRNNDPSVLKRKSEPNDPASFNEYPGDPVKKRRDGESPRPPASNSGNTNYSSGPNMTSNDLAARFVDHTSNYPPIQRKNHVARDFDYNYDVDDDFADLFNDSGAKPTMPLSSNMIPPNPSQVPSHNNMGQPKRSGEDRAYMCVVCHAKERDALFLPCNHCCACLSCGKKVSHCPICRSPISSTTLIYLS